MKKLITQLIISSFYLGFIIFNMSCEIAEPDRFYNDAAVPPQGGVFTIDELQGRTPVFGNIILQIDEKSVGFKVARANLYINSEFYQDYNSDPCRFEIDTRMMENKTYNIEVWVYRYYSEMNHGLLNFAQPPSLVLEGKIKVDNTPPPATHVSLKGYKDNHPVIEWTKSSSQKFLCYRINKASDGGNMEELAAIYDRNVTQFVDTKTNIIYGHGYSYSVTISGVLDGWSSRSNIISFTPGLLNIDSYMNSFYCNKASSEILYFGGNSGSGFVLSTAGDKIIKTMPGYEGTGSFFYNEAENEFYSIALEQDKIYVFDLTTYQLKRTAVYNFKDDINATASCSGPNKDIFALIGLGAIGRINSETGERTGVFTDGASFTVNSMIASNDKTKLYISAIYDSGHYLLMLDISSPEIKLLKKIKVASSADFMTASGDDRIYERDISGSYSNSLRIRDASTLDVIRYIGGETPSKNIYGAFINEKSIFVTTSNSIIEFDKASLTQAREWETSSYPQNVFVTRNMENLYFTSYYAGGHKIYKIKMN